MSHFANVGFDVQDNDALNDLLEKVYSKGDSVNSRQGLYVRYQDESGAELWIQVTEKKELVGINPFFDGESAVRVGIMSALDNAEDFLDGSFYGWANPDNLEGEEPGDYPFVFDLPDFYATTEFDMPSTQRVMLNAFAEQIEIFKSEEEFLELQPTEMSMAPESFIPIGLLDEDGGPSTDPKAFALINGRILACELKHNQLTGQSFWWLFVKTLGGKLDVMVAEEEMIKKPEAGNVVSGTFWLIGRVLDL